jgi:hypothetical protein
VYVDALCAHLNLRIRVIGAFFYRCKPDNKCECCDHEYEDFLEHLRTSKPAQPLEFFALRRSTYVLSVLVSVYGLYLIWAERDASSGVVLILAGLGGLIATDRINRGQKTERKRINEKAEEWKKEDDGDNGEPENNTAHTGL